CATRPQQPRQSIVPFDAARLVIDSVLLLVLLRKLLLNGPRPRPDRRIFYRDHVFECPRPGASPTLDQMQVLARAKEISLRTEVGTSMTSVSPSQWPRESPNH